MEYGQPSWSDKKVSRIMQGTIMLNEKHLEANFELLDAAWETGINAFDTAALYGNGTCERVLGKWMEARGVRDRLLTAGEREVIGRWLQEVNAGSGQPGRKTAWEDDDDIRF